LRNLQLVRCLVELASGLQGFGQIIVRGCVLRIPRHNRLEFLHCRGPIIGIDSQAGQSAVSFTQAGGQLYSFVEFGGSWCFVTPSSQQNSQLKMSGSMIWIQL
jgi:hypothetical protein